MPDARLERVFLVTRGAQLVVEVLHDVHVVGNSQDDHQRRQHAREDVVAEPHHHEQPHRPDDADEHGHDEDAGDAPRAEQHEDGGDGEQEDRRRQLLCVLEGDAVVGLADLEAAVVVHGHAGGQPRVDELVDAIDDAGANGIDPVLVEADQDAGDHPVLGHEIAAQQEVVECELADAFSAAGPIDVVEERLDLDAAVASGILGQAANDVCRREALDALDGLYSLDVAGDLANELEPFPREQSIRLERDEERPLTPELLPEALVSLVDGIVLRDPHADVVVDVREVEERGKGEKTDHDERAERMPPTEDDIRQPLAHLTFSSCRREKSSSVRPVLYRIDVVASSVFVFCRSLTTTRSSTVQMPSTRSSRLTSKTFARSLRWLKMSAWTMMKRSFSTRLSVRGKSALRVLRARFQRPRFLAGSVR